jgi:hypothetical protein
MLPSNKNPTIDEFIFDITGVDRVAAIKENRCVSCKAKVETDFRDDLSKREYSISGLCQTCQDEVFPDFQ